jgi:UDP-N-acetylmuramoyl-tripeptide--D-alanyl-D-alanine ligase
MTAALETLTAIPATGNTFAILGKMHELGDTSDAIHAQIAKLAIEHGVTQVIAVGDSAKSYALPPLSTAATAGDKAKTNGQKSVWLPDFDSACDYIVNEVNTGDVLLFKASRAEQFEVLADRIEVILRAKWGQQ